MPIYIMSTKKLSRKSRMIYATNIKQLRRLQKLRTKKGLNKLNVYKVLTRRVRR